MPPYNEKVQQYKANDGITAYDFVINGDGIQCLVGGRFMSNSALKTPHLLPGAEKIIFLRGFIKKGYEKEYHSP